jgi:[calcium/calmodulin-dependent protein kinase] kinase
MRRILDEKETADLVLTRRVEHVEKIRRHPNVLASSLNHAMDFAGNSASRINARARNGQFASFVREAKVKARERKAEESGSNTPSADRTPGAEGGSSGFSSFVREARDKARERKAEASNTNTPERTPVTEDVPSPLDGPLTPSPGPVGEQRRKRDVARSSAGDVLKGVAKRLDERGTRLQARASSNGSLPTTSEPSA